MEKKKIKNSKTKKPKQIDAQNPFIILWKILESVEIVVPPIYLGTAQQPVFGKIWLCI